MGEQLRLDDGHRRPSQADRVLRALRHAGGYGVTQLDFDVPTIDGGAPIRRVASRVHELRTRGYAIVVRGRRRKMAVYVLTGLPVDGPDA